jgi:hypothetical protein
LYTTTDTAPRFLPYRLCLLALGLEIADREEHKEIHVMIFAKQGWPTDQVPRKAQEGEGEKERELANPILHYNR